MVTDYSERQVLHQLPLESLRVFWRDFESSDYREHRNCGFVPTGTKCHVCKKTLGRALKPPYSYQSDVLDDDHLTMLLAGGEQVGKSYIGAMKFLRILLGFLGEHPQRAANEVAWLVGASYEQTSREFEYIKSWLKQVPQISFWASEKVDPGEIRISVPNGLFRIKTKSSDDAMGSLRAESPVVVLLCEAAITTFDTYTRLRSRVGRARADFPGYGAIVMISTFEGSVGWYPTLYGKWQLPANQEKENAASYSMPSHSNIFIYRKGANDPEILSMKADLSDAEFKERVLALPAPPKGRVFKEFDPTVHILRENAKWDEDEEVIFGIDPGYSGQPSAYAVEVFQKRRLPCGNVHYQGIDEIFDWEKTNSKIVEIAKNRPWWKSDNKKGVVDVAGQSHAGAQDPVAEVWRKEAGINLKSERVNVLPGIYRMAALLNTCADPKCGEPVLVVSPKQQGLIAELGGLPHPFDGQSHPYRWTLDRSGEVVGRTPRDEYCDAIKATTYLFINELGYTLHKSSRTKIKVKKRERSYAYA